MSRFWNKDKIEEAIKKDGGVYPLRIIVGENRIGKTWGGVDLINQAVLRGENGLWMRMFDEEFKGEFCDNFMNIMNTLDPSLSISTDKDDKGRLSKCEGGIKCDNVQRVYFRSLNVFGKARGNGSTTGDVTIGVLDEFIPEDGRTPKKGIYIPMMALIRTFTNYNENFVCYCFANCVTPLSDLFATLKCFPKRGQDITLFPEQGVAIEICRGYEGAIPDNGPWSKVVESGKMRKYKEFEGMYIDDFIVKPKKPMATKTSLKISETEFLSLHNDDSTQVWMLASKPPTGATVFSTDADIKCVFLDGKIKNEIRKMFFGGRYRFNSYNALSRFLSIIDVTLI